MSGIRAGLVVVNALWCGGLGYILGRMWGQRRDEIRKVTNIKTVMNREASAATFTALPGDAQVKNFYKVVFQAMKYDIAGNTPIRSMTVEATQLPVPREIATQVLQDSSSLTITYDDRDPRRFIITQLLDKFKDANPFDQNPLVAGFSVIGFLLPIIILSASLDFFYGFDIAISFFCWFSTLWAGYACQLTENPISYTFHESAIVTLGPLINQPQQQQQQPAPSAPLGLSAASAPVQSGLAYGNNHQPGMGMGMGMDPAPVQAQPGAVGFDAYASPSMAEGVGAPAVGYIGGNGIPESMFRQHQASQAPKAAFGYSESSVAPAATDARLAVAAEGGGYGDRQTSEGVVRPGAEMGPGEGAPPPYSGY